MYNILKYSNFWVSFQFLIACLYINFEYFTLSVISALLVLFCESTSQRLVLSGCDMTVHTVYVYIVLCTIHYYAHCITYYVCICVYTHCIHPSIHIYTSQYIYRLHIIPYCAHVFNDTKKIQREIMKQLIMIFIIGKAHLKLFF